ncbi:MAG: hypothetical protein GWN58_26875, partial [Anaerolineae bacterium]|nr:hypothetical protein [Anaerolineae bacterium]
MSNERKSVFRREWPRWIVVPIGLGLAGLAVALGLLLEPAGHALSPSGEAATPTLPAVAYGRDISGGCHDCHFSLPALEASAVNPNAAEEYLIEPESVWTNHGSLGCVACHRGDGEAKDKEAGHAGLMLDVTQEDPQQC